MRLTDIDKYSKSIAGKQFNDLIAICAYRHGREIYIKCRCICGNITKTRKDRLDKVKSCGCKSRNSVNGEAAFNKVYSGYRGGAKRRGLVFDITKEQFRKITKDSCVYCGVEPSRKSMSKTGEYIYNRIDRLDNNKGYTVDNCRACCTRCNFFKGTMASNVFLETAISIVKNNTLKNGFTIKKLKSYHKRAITIAKNSHDKQTQVGAILINPHSGAVIADGFNGFVRGAPDDKLPNTRPDKYKYMIHAEMNLICNAVRHGIQTQDCVLYTTMSPCVQCARMVWQAGIDTVYFKDTYSDFNKSVDMGDLIITIKKIGQFNMMSIRSKT